MNWLEASIKQVQAWNLYDISEVTVLDEMRHYWIAKAVTTHNRANGGTEVELLLLAQGMSFLTFNISVVPALLEYLKVGNQ